MSLKYELFQNHLAFYHFINLCHQTNSQSTDTPSNIEEWLETENIPAIGIGVTRDGKLKEIRVYGKLENNRTAPYNTLWKVASLTKPIMSIITLKLVNNKDWDLDEPLYKYWIDPDVKDDPFLKLLTTRHVITHQTGFLNWRRMHASKKLKFDFEPGSKFNYSGEGFEYLRRAIEAKFNQSIEEIADSLIFEPLSMTDTKFKWDASIDESRYAKNHDKVGNLIPTIKNKEANGADHVVSTIEDYGKFGCYVLNGAGLDSTLFKEMFTKQVSVNADSDFGLGWEIIPNFLNGDDAIYHSGSDPGAKSMIILFPTSKKGLIIFSNSDKGGYPYWSEIINYELSR